MIIAFFGPDGAGKTTHSRLLGQYLKKRGFKVALVRLKSHHMGMYLLLRLLYLLNIIPRTNSPKTHYYSMRRIFGRSRIFPFLEVLNMLPWLLFNIELRLATKHIIIAERYLPDFLVALNLITSHREYLCRTPLLKAFILKYLCRNDTFYIYLKAKPGILCERKKNEELTQNFITANLSLYQKIYEFLSAHKCKTSLLCIDTSSQPIMQPFDQIIKHINSFLQSPIK